MGVDGIGSEGEFSFYGGKGVKTKEVFWVLRSRTSPDNQVDDGIEKVESEKDTTGEEFSDAQGCGGV